MKANKSTVMHITLGVAKRTPAAPIIDRSSISAYTVYLPVCLTIILCVCVDVLSLNLDLDFIFSFSLFFILGFYLIVW